MSEKAEEHRSNFREKKMSAFVVGYTGEVGKELVKALLESQIFARLILVGRREVKFEGELYQKVEQKVVDFDKLDDYAEVFKDIDAGFCCLGTTRGKAGAKGFYKVDHDYVVNTAKLAKNSGCKSFHLVTSQGANKDSYFLYPKTKGEAEEELKAMDFDKLAIYRPAMLMCNREESRPMENVARWVLKPVAWASPTLITTPTSLLAQAMVNVAVFPTDHKIQLFHNKDIFAAAGELKQ